MNFLTQWIASMKVPDAMDRFKLQEKYRLEGVAAGREGDTRDDCPYDRTTESEAWNFWVYGCEDAASERASILRGGVNVACYTTGGRSHGHVPSMMPVEEAIQTGRWTPRHFTKEEALALTKAAKERRP